MHVNEVEIFSENRFYVGDAEKALLDGAELNALLLLQIKRVDVLQELALLARGHVKLHISNSHHRTARLIDHEFA